jgi:putative ABC transport system ATP-binding protein
MGFIFQSFNLISSMTAQENAAFPMRFAGVSASERRKRSMELLKLVGLEKRAFHKPTELSGGQQQRVAVARALVNNPRIILADEPTGNLDTTSGFSVMNLLSDLHHNGRTLIVVTHDPRMLRFATHVIYLLDGAVVSGDEYRATVERLNQDGNLNDEEKHNS